MVFSVLDATPTPPALVVMDLPANPVLDILTTGGCWMDVRVTVFHPALPSIADRPLCITVFSQVNSEPLEGAREIGRNGKVAGRRDDANRNSLVPSRSLTPSKDSLFTRLDYSGGCFLPDAGDFHQLFFRHRQSEDAPTEVVPET